MKGFRGLLFCAVVLACTLAAGAGVVRVPVAFNVSTGTVPGESVFVVGNCPELGAWDPVRALKLIPTNCAGSTCDWMATVGLPEGKRIEYKYVFREDCPTCYSNTANVTWESTSNRVVQTAAGPPAPFPGKTIFYYSAWTNVTLVYHDTNAGWTNRAMRANGPGRNAGETLWRIDDLNNAGDTNLVFVFTNNEGDFDNPFGPGTNYETPLDACLVQDGHVFNYWPPATVSVDRVTSFFLNATNLPGRTVRVYLPRGYDSNTNKYYPVLYMHDGQNLFENMGAFGSWNADTNAQQLIRLGKMREIIIVGIDNTGDRICEYTPPDCDCDVSIQGKGDHYADMLIQELKPIIDGTYRTLGDPWNTGTLGSSMGGLISIYLGWDHTNTFRHIGAFSTAFWRCGATGDRLATDARRGFRLYIDSGDSGNFTFDGLALTVDARDSLAVNGYVFYVDLDHVIGYGHIHNEFWWDLRLPRCYLFLFPICDEANSILDTHAYPLRITAFTRSQGSNRLAWTRYQRRKYRVEGVTNRTLSGAVTWNPVGESTPVESRPWSDLPELVTSNFYFLRVIQESVSGWPE